MTCVAHVGSNHQLAVLVSSDFSFSTVCNESWIKPIETESERQERERLEAAYDLFCCAITEIRDFLNYSFEDFCNDIQASRIWLKIVDKTGYRKEK